MIDVFKELDNKFDLFKQINGLSNLLSRETRYFSDTFDWHFNHNYFRDWHLSSGMMSLYELKQALGLQDDSYYPTNEYDAIRYLQCSFNVVNFASQKLRKYVDYTEFFSFCKKQFKYIMEKAGLEILEDEAKDYYLIIPKNEKTRKVAELQSDKNVVFKLYEYTANEYKGNIAKKQEILNVLANETELITKSYKKKQGDFYNIYDDLDFALNNFNIRHNNKDGKHYKKHIAELGHGELEKLYDKTYDLILDVILINDYLQGKTEFDNIKNLI